MTWGITVAPRMPTASSRLPAPSNRGTSPPATAAGSGLARNTCTAKATTMTPTKPAITASSRRNPRACMARMAYEATAVMAAAGRSGIPNNR